MSSSVVPTHLCGRSCPHSVPVLSGSSSDSLYQPDVQQPRSAPTLKNQLVRADTEREGLVPGRGREAQPRRKGRLTSQGLLRKPPPSGAECGPREPLPGGESLATIPWERASGPGAGAGPRTERPSTLREGGGGARGRALSTLREGGGGAGGGALRPRPRPALTWSHGPFLSPFPSGVQRHHQVLREGEAAETLPAQPVQVSLLRNLWQSMKTGQGEELDPGHLRTHATTWDRTKLSSFYLFPLPAPTTHPFTEPRPQTWGPQHVSSVT